MRKFFAAAFLCSMVFAKVQFVEKGTEVPVQIKTDGDALSIVGGDDLKMVVNESIYLKLGDEGVFFSFDQEDWLPLSDYFKGSCGYSINFYDDVFTSIEFNADFFKQG